MAITAAFGSMAAKEIGDYADKKMKDARDVGDLAEAAKWEEGGVYRVAAHTAAGALAGGIGGALGAGASAAAMPKIGEMIDGMDLPEPVKQALGAAAATSIGAAAGGVGGAATAFNTDVNNRMLHPGDRKAAKTLAELSKGKYTEEEILAAMRYAGLRDKAGNIIVAENTQETFVKNVDIKTGKTIQETLAADNTMSLVSVPGDQVTLLEKPPTRPSNELMAYITANTGGTASPYVFTPGPANAAATGEGNPRYHACVTAECLLYGANRNPTNPQNMAEDKNFNAKLAAAGIIAGVPLAFAASAPTLIAMGTTAQTVPLVGGLAGVAGGKWVATATVGGFFGAFGDFATDADASPASMAVGAAAGAIGAAAKLGLNATYGLANQWVPTTAAGARTAIGSKATGGVTKQGLHQTGDASSGTSWWTTPVMPCGPIIPRSPCQ